MAVKRVSQDEITREGLQIKKGNGTKTESWETPKLVRKWEEPEKQTEREQPEKWKDLGCASSGGWLSRDSAGRNGHRCPHLPSKQPAVGGWLLHPLE